MEEENRAGPAELAKSFVKRAKQDRDVALAITGYEGEGKSDLGANIVIEILRHLGFDDDKIAANFNEYMIYSPNKEEIEKKVKRPEKYVPINSDEAVKALYKLNWASADQKFLNMLYTLCRKENKISMFLMPRFTDFNEYFRNHRIMYWIHVLDRGIAVLMQKDWNPFTRDPWHLLENEKLIGAQTKRKKIVDYDVEDKVNLLRKTVNFVALVKWEKLDNRFRKVYLEGKEKFGYDDMKQADANALDSKRERKYRESLITTAINLQGGGMGVYRIAEVMGLSKDTVYKLIDDSKDMESVQPLLNNKTTSRSPIDISIEEIEQSAERGTKDKEPEPKE